MRPVTPLGILVADLDALAGRVTDPGLREEVEHAAALAGGLDPYLTRCTTPESPALAALARRTREHDWSGGPAELGLEAEMLSGHLEGQLLKALVALTGARRVLEIGMFTGYSALAMAEALPADGIVVACEVDPDVAAFARDAFAASAAGGRIDVRVGPATGTLRALADAGERFDLVFLDADKAGYWSYLDTVLEAGLLAEGGAILVDNTLLQGQPWLPGRPSGPGAAIADFNARLAADPRVEQVLLPLRDGLTIVRRVAP